MIHRTLLLAAAAAAVATPAAAQLGEPRPVQLGCEHELPVTNANGVRIGIDVCGVSAGGAVYTDERTTVRTSVATQVLSFDLSRAPALAPARLQAGTVSTTVMRRLGGRWSGILGAGAGLASSLDGPLSRDDFFVSGNAIVAYTLVPALTLGAGVGYDARTGTFSPLPLAAVNWEPTSTFAIRSIFPASTTVAWRPARPVTLELVSALDGNRFHLSGAGRPADTSLAYSVVKAGGGARFHLGGAVHLEVLATALLRRRYEPFVRNHSQGDVEIPATAAIGVNLWIGPSGWRSDLAR